MIQLFFNKSVQKLVGLFIKNLITNLINMMSTIKCKKRMFLLDLPKNIHELPVRLYLTWHYVATNNIFYVFLTLKKYFIFFTIITKENHSKTKKSSLFFNG